MAPRRSSGMLLTASLVLIALLVAFGPPERVLGVHVRVVYLHGAWVWTALVGFAVAAVLLQVGLAVLARSAWASGMNIAFLVALVWSLANAQQVMHPSSPIFSSPSLVIQ